MIIQYITFRCYSEIFSVSGVGVQLIIVIVLWGCAPHLYLTHSMFIVLFWVTMYIPSGIRGMLKPNSWTATLRITLSFCNHNCVD